MGTKGIIVVHQPHFTVVDRNAPILAMRSDGYPANLTALAGELLATAKNARVLGKFRKAHTEIVRLIMQIVAEKHPDICFVSTYGEAEWVNTSAILNAQTGEVRLRNYKSSHWPEI